MTSMELVPIVVASSVFGCHWEKKRILVHCDNEGTAFAIKIGYSNKVPIANLLRQLMTNSMKHNFYIKAKHIPGKNNIKADLLSRFQIAKFLQLTSEADRIPTAVNLNVL